MSTNWERLDHPPYYRFVGKTSPTLNNTISLESRSMTPVKENLTESEVDTGRVLTSERQASEERSGSCGSAKAFAESGLSAVICILISYISYFNSDFYGA